MSQENVELLRRACEHAAKTGELPRDLCHPDLVWDTTTFGGFNAERCIGVDEANRWLARALGRSSIGRSKWRRPSKPGIRWSLSPANAGLLGMAALRWSCA